jgi:hypothetical protein
MKWQPYKNSGKPLAATFPPLLQSFRDHIGNQEVWNGCTAWATMADFIRVRVAEGYPREQYSRLAEFWMSRKLYGQQIGDPSYITKNGGVYEDNALETLIDYGPMLAQYDPDTWGNNWVQEYQLQPPDKWMANEKLSWDQVYQIDTSNPDQKLADTLDALAQGYPVLTSMMVFGGIFNPPTTGYIPDPAPNEQNVGAHEVNVCEPNMSAQRLSFPNSWGPGWGDNGDGWISFDYFKKYAFSLFVIVPKVATPAPAPVNPAYNLKATFIAPSVPVSTNIELDIHTSPHTQFTVSVTSPALDHPALWEATTDVNGDYIAEVAWPKAGVYSYAVSANGQTVTCSAEWK